MAESAQSNYRASMRMGAIDLLVVVVAICLVVLGTLAVVSAKASASFSDMQAHTVSETYAQEVAAQTFLAYMSDTIDGTKDGSAPSASALQADAERACQSAALAYPDVQLSCEVTAMGQDALYDELGVSAYERSTSALADLPKSDRAYVRQVIDEIGSCSTGVQVDVSSEGIGRRLSILIGFADGGGYKVLAWRSAAGEWEEPQESLWISTDGL